MLEEPISQAVRKAMRISVSLGVVVIGLALLRSAPRPIGTPVFLFLCQIVSCGLLFIPFVAAELIPVLWLAVLTFCTVGLAWFPLVSLRLSEEPQEKNRSTWTAFFSTNVSTLGAALICSFSAMTYAALLLLLLQDNLNVQSISSGVVAAVSADLSVYSLLRFRSRENWMIVAIITVAFSVVVLGFDRLSECLS